MPDVLIRNLPADDLALLDEHAARQGLSRTETAKMIRADRRLREMGFRGV